MTGFSSAYLSGTVDRASISTTPAKGEKKHFLMLFWSPGNRHMICMLHHGPSALLLKKAFS